MQDIPVLPTPIIAAQVSDPEGFKQGSGHLIGNHMGKEYTSFQSYACF